ncbi:MAG: T9SS type A sorting domain-containing protein [Flavobacteriales bacterium]
MIFRPSLLILSLLAGHALLAQYNGPESVEYDPVGDRYLVSNTGSGAIKVRDQSGTVTDLVTVSPAPYGLEIIGDTVFACSGGGIKGYSITDGTLVFNHSVGGTFLNGITTDGTFLYTTDFSAGRIYKVDVAQDSHTTLVASTGGSPNGIVWDPVGERLVVVFWGSNAAIRAYDRNTGAATTLVAGTGLTNIDGVTIDCLGNFLVASWSPDRITRYDPTFTQPAVDLGVTGLNNPADIDFDTVNGRVCIPNSGNNTVTLFEVNCTTGIPEDLRDKTRSIVPNPARDLVRIEPALAANTPYVVMDVNGRLVGSGTLSPNALLDVRTLETGTYTVVLTGTGTRLRLVKE